MFCVVFSFMHIIHLPSTRFVLSSISSIPVTINDSRSFLTEHVIACPNYLYYTLSVSWLGKIAKSLFIFLFFYFILSWTYYTEGSTGRCHITSVTVTWQEVTLSHHMGSHDGSHDRHGKLVHRPCSSCISSIENLIGTLSSSLCQTLIKSSWLYSGSGVGSLTKWYLYNMCNMRIRHNRIVI